MTSRRVYLDWNATTPPHERVLVEMERVQREVWANPASVHRPGQQARSQLERARAAVGELLGRDGRDVTLTSGGTEANNLALWQPFAAGGEGLLVVGRIEHPSVLRMAEALAQRGIDVRWIEPGRDGRVPAEAFERALTRGRGVAPLLVSLQAVNHETGVIQPVADVAELTHAHGGLLHVDAVQAAGKLPPLGWGEADLVTVSAHKLRGPKGIGALVSRAGLKLRPLLRGGAQERGVRPGTQCPAAAAGFAVAAQLARDGPQRYAELAALRDRLQEGVMALAARLRPRLVVERNGTAARAPHVLNLSLAGWRSAELCAAMDLEGVAIASGSACSAGSAEPSPVIEAMLGPERARGAIRSSMGDTTTARDVAFALAAFERVLSRSAEHPASFEST